MLPFTASVLFDDLKSGKDFYSRSKCGGDTAILLFRQLDCLSDCLWRDAATCHYMVYLHPRESSRMFLAPTSLDQHTVAGDLLPFLLQDSDHVNTRTTAERHQ